MRLTIVKTSEEEYNSLPYYEDHTIYLLDNGRIFVEGIEYGNYQDYSEGEAIGSEIQPVYIDEYGTPQPLEYTIETSVPKDAKFSYEVVNENEDGLMSSADKVKFDEIYSEMYEIKDSVSNGKKIIADSITYKGVNTNKDDTFDTLAENIKKIKSGDNGSSDTDEVPSGLIPVELGDIYSAIGSYGYLEKLSDVLPNEGISKENMSVVYNNKINIFVNETVDYRTFFCHHYELNEGYWQLVSTIPSIRITIGVVVYDNEIHLFGSDPKDVNKHYKWDGASWTEEPNAKYDGIYGFPIVYNNAIHLIGCVDFNIDSKLNKHYKWDGVSWSTLAELPSKFNYPKGTVLIHNNAIYCFAYDGCYKWNDYSWTKLSSVTGSGSGYRCSVVYNNMINVFEYEGHHTIINNSGRYVLSAQINIGDMKSFPIGDMLTYNNNIHLFSGSRHFILYSDPYTESCIKKNFYNYFRDLNGFVQTYGVKISAPSDYITCEGDAVVCNNEIHAMCTYNITCYYKYDGRSWSNVGKLSENIKGSSILFYNNKINVLGGNKTMRKWFRLKPNETLLEDTNNDLPVNFTCGCSVVYNNEIHILCYREHYKWDGTSWTKISDIPVSIYLGSAVVYNNEIHIVCYNSYSSSYHYKWNGTSWSVVCSTSNTPSTNVYNSRAVVYKDKIVLLCNNKRFYTWKKGNTNWYIYTSPVVNFYKGAMVVYNNDVHAIGGYGEIEHWIINKKSEFNIYAGSRQVKIDF